MNKSYNPCDDCQYNHSKQNQESGMCKYCEFKKYIDLEEQGLILRLPCKVGDTVYRLGYKPCHNGETYPDSYNCCGCEDDCDIKRDIIPCFVRDLDWVLRNYKYLTSKSDYMFLTKEEAEAKLKELEGSEDK